MDIQCTCGQFRATLSAFPRHTPGRFVCYCDDCQHYLHHLGRSDLLDEHGGTEVIPVYPAEIAILSGQEHLQCTRLTEKGAFRFSTRCCNTPLVNTYPGLPWMGVFKCLYPSSVDQLLGPVRARVMGKFALGTPPVGTARKINLRMILIALPFLLKGKLLGKSRPSPFFQADGVTPIVTADIVTPQ